jgi:hypothetical protein
MRLKIKKGAWCCLNMKSDPLHQETSTTKPVDFHSFRRAFGTALAEGNVNAQRAMQLSAHSDEKVHARYVMHTAAMRKIPDVAIPQLPPGLFGQLGQPVLNGAFPDGIDPNSPAISAPPTRLELVAFGLGSRPKLVQVRPRGALAA